MSDSTDNPATSSADSATRPSIAARIEPVLAELRARGWDEGRHPLHVFDDGVRTAAAAAASIGCEVGAIANSLIFDAAGTPVLILTSGAHRVDTAKTAATIGVSELGRAAPDFVREHTGQTIGGVAPIGHPAPLRTIVDTELANYPQLWAAAGHAHTVFPLSYAQLIAITHGEERPVEP